jgi:CheY-like chemotaxis protein
MLARAVDGGPAALEVLRAAAARSEPFDLAILDKQMPVMDGIELAEAIRHEPPIAGTRLVMLTSAGIRGEADEARRAGLAGYLTKPVRQSQLYACLTAVMGRPGGAPLPLVTRHSLRDAGARARAHVLVAEDNAVNQKVAVKMLEKLGYRADVAGNGVEAVEALERIRYAAVLMDCQMPEMDGYDAAREIRRREAAAGPSRVRTPIVAMTAGALRDNAERCRNAGMDDFVPKPVDIDHLADVLLRWVPSPAPPATPPPAAHVQATPAAMAIPLDSPLDATRLESLRQMTGGREALGQVVEMFLQEAPGRIAALSEAVERQDAHALEFAAHRLKGGAGTLGAKRLAVLCEGLEVRAREGSCAGAADVLPEVRRELDRACAALLAEVAPA